MDCTDSLFARHHMHLFCCSFGCLNHRICSFECEIGFPYQSLSHLGITQTMYISIAQNFACRNCRKTTAVGCDTQFCQVARSGFTSLLVATLELIPLKYCISSRVTIFLKFVEHVVYAILAFSIPRFLQARRRFVIYVQGFRCRNINCCHVEFTIFSVISDKITKAMSVLKFATFGNFRKKYKVSP